MWTSQQALSCALILQLACAGGPGSYGHYEWPAGVGQLASAMSMDHVWSTLPKADETHGNAVFAATQHWFSAGPGAYMGTQAWRQSNGTMTYRALFSCWDADAVTQTGWVDGSGYCERFGGEGTGAHCIIPVVLRQGAHYTVRVGFSGANASGAMWTGTFLDVDRQASQTIGTLFHPNFAGAVGYGNMSIAAADFQEYFLADGCAGQAVAAVGLIGPTLTLTNGSLLQPVNASPDYAAGCNFSDVSACIPGFGCGKPNLLMVGGGETRRVAPAGTPLW